MPYEWQNPSDSFCEKHLVLWPHRSLPRRGFVVFILVTFAMLTLPLSPVLGTLVFWGLLPFLLIALAGLWWGLERSYRDMDIREDLVIGEREVSLTRTNPDGALQQWECNRYWVQVEMHVRGGRVPHYITLRGSDRQVEIGAFLSEDERIVLFPELTAALQVGERG